MPPHCPCCGDFMGILRDNRKMRTWECGGCGHTETEARDNLGDVRMLG